jgi:hypothetical protein
LSGASFCGTCLMQTRIFMRFEYKSALSNQHSAFSQAWEVEMPARSLARLKTGDLRDDRSGWDATGSSLAEC